MKNVLLYLFILFSLSTAIFLPNPTAVIHAAFLPADAILLASDIEVPARPTPPKAPTVSNLKKEHPADHEEPLKKATQRPIHKQKPEPAPAATAEKNPDSPAEKSTDGDAAQSADKNSDTGETTTTQEILNEAFTQEPKENVPETTLNNKPASVPLIDKLLYAAIMIALIGFTAYLYFTTPKGVKEPPPRRRTAAPNIPEQPRKKDNPATPVQPFSLEVKIKNPSLLEQLVKYDMEAYGELRADLDYEQPAYVERLIRKYGNGDQAKINRAINLFYTRRNNK